jgi:hypothetical protein
MTRDFAPSAARVRSGLTRGADWIGARALF